MNIHQRDRMYPTKRGGYLCADCLPLVGDSGDANPENIDTDDYGRTAKHRGEPRLDEAMQTQARTNIDNLRALVRDVSRSVTHTVTTDELAHRIAEKTPPDELFGLYRSALHFAVDRILEESLHAAMDTVSGSKQGTN